MTHFDPLIEQKTKVQSPLNCAANSWGGSLSKAIISCINFSFLKRITHFLYLFGENTFKETIAMGGKIMPLNVTEKLIKDHLVSGKMIPGEEIGLKIDRSEERRVGKEYRYRRW